MIKMLSKLTVICTLFLTGCSCLRLITYHIPSIADFREEVALSCDFDPEGQRLHSVRWFLNGTEFFRSTPRGNFIQYMDGVIIKLTKSNITTVVLVPLHFTTSGEFRCEASTAPPLYRTLAISKRMTVVALPKEGPSIEGIHPSHTWGDDIFLNCTSSPSYPTPEIYWMINDELVSEDNVISYDSENDAGLHIRSSKAGVRLQVDQLPFGSDAEVMVSCVALVPGIYKSMVSLRLAKAQAINTV